MREENTSKDTIVSADLSQEKGRKKMSKSELKMALVAKRISMLQDDDDHHHHQLTPQVLSSQKLMLCDSIKPSGEVSDDTQFDDIVISKFSQNRKNHGSHKRAKVLSDDESSEDRELIACIQPRKEGRPKRKVSTSNLSNDGGHEDVEAPDNPRIDQNIRPKKKAKRKSLSRDEDFTPSGNPRKQQNIQRMNLTDNSSTKSSAMKRAEEVQANLSTEHPSFVKLMLKSHVSGGFWLGLPKKFCDDHLPDHDATIVLVDEVGKKTNTNYLVAKSGLSGGWRGFSIDHDLLEGDVVVFYLIEPTIFKIFIISEKSCGDVDGALGLLTLDTGVGQQNSDDYTQKTLQLEDHAQKVLEIENHAQKVLQTEGDTQNVLQTEFDSHLTDHLSQSSSDVDLGPEVLDGIRFSDSEIKFEGIEVFENFNIIVDGLIMDAKFPDSTRKKYYELCRGQGSFLHDNLLKGLNCNLIIGVISETINIADAIYSCKFANAAEDLQNWEKTLKGFEFFGMEVGFLLARLNQLQGRDFESKTDYESNRLKECITKRAFAGEKLKELENNLTKVIETMGKIDVELQAEIKKAKQEETGGQL